MTGQELSPPRKRTCERCGRRDVWNDETGHWQIAVEDGVRRTGDEFCIHEWDVNGAYKPFRTNTQ